MNEARKTCSLIRYALWNTEACEADEAVFEEMERQAVAALPAAVLTTLSLPPELLKKWQLTVFRQVSFSFNYRYFQDRLPLTVPYVILKGTAAAKYYPHPEYRTLGDIDLMTRREDFAAACGSLLAAGFAEITLPPLDGVMRHRGFRKNGIDVEIHAYFAKLSDPDAAQYLDDLILRHINPSHLLPDMINGAVILEHISQHLEEGLGLRQIIDWMMFVARCLPDEQWPAFREIAEKTGLERLAAAVTRMCELYLGLEEHAWCREADEAACAALMDYLFACGNFGKKRDQESFTSERVLSASRSPAAVFAMLQRHGLHNWPAAERHPALRPFAWLYQAGRYLRKGLLRGGALKSLRAEARAARERNWLFDALGVRQTSSGTAVYEDGRFVRRSRIRKGNEAGRRPRAGDRSGPQKTERNAE